MKTVYIIRDIWDRINGVYSSYDKAKKEYSRIIANGGEESNYYITVYLLDVSIHQLLDLGA